MLNQDLLKSVIGGIPNGLFVSGFLANAAMLSVDKIVNELVRKKKIELAHFRSVDNHAIIAHDFDELCEWIDW